MTEPQVVIALDFYETRWNPGIYPRGDLHPGFPAYGPWPGFPIFAVEGDYDSAIPHPEDED